MEGGGNEIYHTMTKRDKPKLVRAGYAYVQDKRGRDCIYWRCEKRDQLHCNCRLKTVEGVDKSLQSQITVTLRAPLE